MATGRITRKDIIDDEALRFGEEYAKSAKVALDANEQLVASAKELSKIINSYRKAENKNAFLEAKQQEQIALTKSINAIKAEEAAMLSAEKVKQAAIATEKAQAQAEAASLTVKNKVQATQKTGQKLTAEEIVNQRILAKNADNHALANSRLASEYDKLTAKAKIAARNLQNIQIAGRQADESTAQYTVRLQKAQREYQELDAKVVAATRAINRFNDNVGNYPKGMAAGVRDLVNAFGLVTGIQLFVSITKQAFEIVKNFEAELVNLAAIAGKGRDEIAPLEAKIREVAAASINSATDVAKLATELIKLGSTTEEAEKLLQPVNNLSIALRATAEDSATLVKSLLNSYQEGAEEAVRFTDVLAESANRSALDFDGLRDSFSYLAPTAHTLGLTVERTAAIIGVLADNGIKAESAGRLTSTAFIRLAQSGLTYEDALKKITDAQKANRSELEVLSLAGGLFGAEAAKIGIILANNVGKIDESTTAYENAGGALQELTDKQLKSVSAELQILDSAWEEFILNTNEAADGTVRVTSVIRFLSSNLSAIVNGITLVVLGWAAYKAAVFLANVQTRLQAQYLRATAVAQGQNATAAAAGATAQNANTVATTIATTAWQRFNAALKANALGLAIAAIIYLVSVMDAYGHELEKVTEATMKSTDAFIKNRDITAKNAVSIKHLSDRYDELKGKQNLSSEEQKELNKIIEVLAKTVPGAVTEIDKYGNALEINTNKTREYVKANNELYNLQSQKKLRENLELQKKLRSEQETLTISESDLNAKYVEGIGYIQKRNGHLELYNRITRGSRALTEDELLDFKTKVAQNEKNNAIVERNIQILRGRTAAQMEDTKASADDAAAKAEAHVRTIADIDAEIKAQEDLIAGLSDKSGKQGNAIKARIAALKAERELIYSTDKASADADDKRLRRLKEINDALYDLNKFRLEQKKIENEDIISDPESGLQEKLDALFENAQIQEEIARNSAEKKLKDISRYNKDVRDLTDEEIDTLLNGGTIKKQLLNQEIQAIEEFAAEKKRIGKKTDRDGDDLTVADFEKQMREKAAAREKDLNDALDAENQLLLSVQNSEAASQADREQAVEDHERKVFEIKKKFATDALKLQIAEYEARIASGDLTAEQIKDAERKLSEFKRQLSDLEIQQYEGDAEKRVNTEEESAEIIKDLSRELYGEIKNLTNTMFDNRIAKIDDDIAANNAYYENLIESARNDQGQREALEKERDAKNKALEKKKREEQRKQAIYNRAMAIAETIANTAASVIRANRENPFPASLIIGGLYAAIGAAQITTILATPLPKYKGGRKGGPAELAVVGDGGVSEVITKSDGSNPRFTPATSTLAYLEKDDIVHKSMSDYDRFMRDSLLQGVRDDNRKASNGRELFTMINDNSELLKEMRLTRAVIEKQKLNVNIQTGNIDINQHLWAMANKKWN